MRLLLDTHALLWFLDGDDRIGGKTRDAILDAANEIFVSMVTFFELAIKIRIGKLDNDLGKLMAGAEDAGLSVLDLDPAHCRRMATIPEIKGHRDPFDILLVAQAMAEDMVLVTDDRYVSSYGARTQACA